MSGLQIIVRVGFRQYCLVDVLEDSVAGVRELARYSVLSRPLVVVRIIEGVGGRRRYLISEPKVSGFARRVLRKVYDAITRDVRLLEEISSIVDIDTGIDYALSLIEKIGGVRIVRKSGEEPRGWKSVFDRLLKRQAISGDEALAIAYYIARDFVGYGPIDPMIRDKYVEDISCNGLREPIYVFHRDFEWLESNIVFTSIDELERVVLKLALRAGQEPSLAKPVVEGVIRPEGYRVHLVMDVVSRRGHSFTIRKFRGEPFTIVELINRRTLDPMVAAYLWLAIDYKQGVVIYGPTGSGKTTLMNALALLLPPELKIVTAEDTPEISLPFHDNWMAMVTRLSSEPGVQNVTLQAQVESALRQRPDVIILGEIRAREAYSFFQAVTTGHGGLTTIHAEDTETLINRLSSPPMNVPRSSIASVKAFVFISRLYLEKTFVRKVIKIDECKGFDPITDRIELSTIIRWNRRRDEWYMTSRESSMFKSICATAALDYEELFEDFERRATVLYWAAKRNFDIVMFHTIVRRYRRDPMGVYKQAVSEVGKYPIKIREESSS